MFYELLLDDQLTWNIPILAGLLCIIFIYFLLIKHTHTVKFISIQPTLFIAGTVLLYLLIGSPITAIIHLSFSLHMMQMSILYFIIPPLILLGIPESVFTNIRNKLRISKIRIYPLSSKIVLYIFAALLLIYHLPFVLQILSQDAVLQNNYLFLLFVLAFGMWWPLTTPYSEKRLSAKSKKRYVFLSGMIIMPACLLFIFSALLDTGSNPFISQLTAHLCLPDQSSLLPPPFNTGYDQFMAGILMMGLHKASLIMTLKVEKTVCKRRTYNSSFNKNPLIINK